MNKKNYISNCSAFYKYKLNVLGNQFIEDLIEQDPIEWNDFCNYIESNYKINYGLEIGSFCGGTLYSLCQIAEDNATIISIDNLTHPKKNTMPFIKFIFNDRLKIFNILKKENQSICCIDKNSTTNDTINEVKKILGDNKLDYLFIDGDHSYEGIKNDFENYSSLVKKKGLIAIHDINCKQFPEINKYFKNLINSNNYYYSKKFINQNNNYGIGIIIK